MKITIYSTMTCPYCFELKDWLKSKDIKFKEYLVDIDPKKDQQRLELSGQDIVPFTTIEYKNGKVAKIIGFNKAKFNRALKKNDN